MTDSNSSSESATDQPAAATTESSATSESAALQLYQPLRIWPLLIFVIGLVATRSFIHIVENPTFAVVMVSFMGPLIFEGLIILWWLFASRATVNEKVTGLAILLAAAGLTIALLDKTMGFPGVVMITVPVGLVLFSLGAILFSRVLSFPRTLLISLLAVVGFGFSTMLRAEGIGGDFRLALKWRWDPTHEQLMLADADKRAKTDLADVAAENLDEQLLDPAWPAFRGPDRDGRQSGITLQTDWNNNVTKPLWKIPVGPAWSSFVVAGDLLFTQEQRGEQECILCYDANSGAEIWIRPILSRFEEAMGGPGPRATPTLAKGQLYVMGANGHLLRLDPKTGEILWQTDIREIANRKPPMWGFCSSPLVTDAHVIVHAGGEGDKGTLAFEIESGELAWSAPAGDHTYASPCLITIAGETVLAMITNKELNLLNPTDGSVQFTYPCATEQYRVLQPQLFEQDSLLINIREGKGMRRIRLTNRDGTWSSEELWSSNKLKTDYNDYVIHDGFAYGFDGLVFCCIDLADGSRKWKKGRYGKGQVLLLADAGQLLVLGEKGEVVLLKADPESHTELAQFPALEGKTWNHPVLVGDRLYVRNAQEAAAYRLPLE